MWWLFCPKRMLPCCRRCILLLVATKRGTPTHPKTVVILGLDPRIHPQALLRIGRNLPPKPRLVRHRGHAEGPGERVERPADFGGIDLLRLYGHVVGAHIG